MAARASEIRKFLLCYAARRGIRIQEFLSDEDGRPVVWYAHIEVPSGPDTPRRTATAVSREGFDNALVMAFLYLGNPELDFLPFTDN